MFPERLLGPGQAEGGGGGGAPEPSVLVGGCRVRAPPVALPTLCPQL